MKNILLILLFVAISQNVVDKDYKYQWDPLTNSMKLLPIKYKVEYDFHTKSYIYVKK